MYGRRRQVAIAHFPLRERHLDPVLVECVPQPQQHRTLDVGDAVCGILDPKAEQQIDCAVAELGQVTDGRWRGEHALRPLRHLDGKFAHRVQIAVIRDAKRHIEPDQQARIGPIYDLVGDQVLVRDQVFLAVSAAHRGVACPEIRDGAEGAADLDHVPRLYRALEQQDDAADKVRDDLLQAETDADADGAAEDREGGEVDADRIEPDQQRHRNERYPHEITGQHLHGGAQRRRVLELGVDHPSEAERGPQQDHNH